MTDPRIAELAAKLPKAQRERLLEECRTNGGGARIRCKLNGEGYGTPVNSSWAKLHEKGLVQGKAGSFETVVHTREGWTVAAYLKEQSQ
jgi:hypothetical protein